jgi:hypothetical protein
VDLEAFITAVNQQLVEKKLPPAESGDTLALVGDGVETEVTVP